MPEPSLRDWLFGLELDIPVPVPFHMCDGLKTLWGLSVAPPNGFSPSMWQETQTALIRHLTSWILGNAERSEYFTLYVEGHPIRYVDNLIAFDTFTRRYVSKFLRKVYEFENLGDDLENNDLFELEWIKYKLERMENADEDKNIEGDQVILETVEINGDSFVVLPKDNILSLIRTVDWCIAKNRLEGRLSVEENLEFADFRTPEGILVMELNGLKEPVVTTKKLVLRFYKWIVNYIENLIIRVERIRLNDDAVLATATYEGQQREIITNRISASKFITNREDLKSELYWAILEIWSSQEIENAAGNKRYRHINDVLKIRVQFEESKDGNDYDAIWRPTTYENVISKAVYLYVAEQVGTDTPSAVPKDYFKSSLTKRQFIEVLNKFKQIVLEIAFKMNDELGQSENMEPVALTKPSHRLGMDTVGTRMAGFFESPSVCIINLISPI